MPSLIGWEIAVLTQPLRTSYCDVFNYPWIETTNPPCLTEEGVLGLLLLYMC